MMQGHKPPEIRYAVRIENNGPWTVFDTFIDKPAELGSRLATQMQMSGAEGSMDVLNFIHPANDNGTIP